MPAAGLSNKWNTDLNRKHRGQTRRDDLEEEIALARRCLETRVPRGVALLLREAPASVWLASGLSKTAAEVGRQILTAERGRPTLCLSPRQWLSQPLSPCVSVLVTYRGRNRDAQAVATCLASVKQTPVIVLTGHRNNPAVDVLRRARCRLHVIAAPTHRPESAFVAVRAVIALSALATRLALSAVPPVRTEVLHHKLDDLVTKANDAAMELVPRITSLPDWQSRTWTVLTSGVPEPMRAAYQSLLGESGLASTSWFDAADFLHGNYHAVLNAPSRSLLLVLTDHTADRLGALIARRLGPLIPVFHVSHPGIPEQSLWCHLLTAVFLTRMLAPAAHISLRHPPRPAAAQHWTRWDGQ